MSSVIIEIQQIASASNSDVLELLRKTILVAHKLRLDDMRKWCEHELNGYPRDQELPKYRNLPAEIRAQTMYGGTVSTLIKDPKMAEIINVVPIHDSIPLILDILQKNSGTGLLEAPLFPEQQMILQKAFQSDEYFFKRVFSVSNMKNIVEQAKNTVLNWSLELETKGILGDGITFSQNEKDKAASAQSIRIENFNGILGDVKNSTVHHTGSIHITQNDFESLQKYLSANGVQNEDIVALKAALEAEKGVATKTKFGPKVSDWIGKMVGKASSGTWQVGLEAAGNLLAVAIQKYCGLQGA